MYKNGPPPSYDQPPPPSAPPSYFQSVGGVLPASPFTPAPTCKYFVYLFLQFKFHKINLKFKFFF